MIEVRTVGRRAIDRSLRVARFPFVAVAQLLPGAGRGPRAAAMLFIDRADGTARTMAGELLHDHDLRADGLRRRAAADERQRASELRSIAENEQRAADARLAHELGAAARLREQAEGDGQQRLHQADEQRSKQLEQTQRRAVAQERAVEQARQKQLAAIDKEAKRERLDVLDEQADALDAEDQALTAKDEAQRLRDAASTAKAERKGTA
jgi:hypothetical protein